MKIQLTPTEKKLINLIKSHITTKNLQITPRIAGGWVRDKILNIPSSDIDIALDTISGFDFITSLKESTDAFSNIGLIKPNPDKSKHLETAAVMIDGLYIDFVQLRSETYSNSRIPQIIIGTPLEDALRRDITINSLFYNIMTDKIEDFTGKGVDDLRNGIIRTPLEPKQTFLDDPLRILRVFRFSCRFGFVIENEIFESLESGDIKVALKEKISNERIGIEIHKIISDINGHRGMLNIIENNLVDEVFKPGVEFKINIEKTKLFVKKFLCSACDNKIFNLYTVLHNFIGIKKDGTFLNAKIVKENLMFTKNFTKRIIGIEENIQYLKKNINLMKGDKIELVVGLRKMKDEMMNSLFLYKILYDDDLIEIVKLEKLEDVCNVKPIVQGHVIKKILGCKNDKIGVLVERGVAFQIVRKMTDKNVIMEYLKSQIDFHEGII